MQKVKKVFVTDEVETHALDDIDLEIQHGEYVSISGPSGCGKSTLLAILGLLDTPSAGSYTLNGRPVESLKLSERARIRNREIGFIFQAFNLIGDMTVYENVELPVTYRGMGSDERKRRTLGALDRVGDDPPDEALPGATLRRPAAARCRGACSGGRPRDSAGR
jgi:putative ABC transport system ATP-binding protein